MTTWTKAIGKMKVAQGFVSLADLIDHMTKEGLWPPQSKKLTLPQASSDQEAAGISDE